MNIIIEKISDSDWTVRCGDRYADRLMYEEMIGLVMALSLPSDRPCLLWMKTEEQHRIYHERMVNKS